MTDPARPQSNDSGFVDHRLFDYAGYALLALLAGIALWQAIAGKWQEVGGLVAAAAIGWSVRLVRDKLPSLMRFLLVAALAINAVGYVFSMWHEKTLFDESVHAFTSFAGAAALGWIWTTRSRVGRGAAAPKFFATMLVWGLLIGAAWEAFEWAVGMIGTRRDTMIDLLMDAVGVVAGSLLSWLLLPPHRTSSRLID